MGRIDNKVINDILNQCDIVSVISHYLPVVKAGSNYKCVCPFHDDHDPSMVISPTKQIFSCFVCKTSGNALTFVTKYLKVSVPKALNELIEICNLDISLFNDNQVSEVNTKFIDLYKLFDEALNYMQYELKSLDNQKYYQYLIDRGITDDLIKKFKIGFNPNKNGLTTFLERKKYDLDDAVKVNLLGYNQSYFDIYANRIVFPIFDQVGHPIGITARSLDSDQAKYINTSSTVLYNKSDVVYNYHIAKESYKTENRVIVVEGVMDVIAFSKVGINCVVATLGTACTKKQLQLIRSISSNICFCYDPDTAGQLASYKAGQLAQQLGFDIKIIDNKTNYDPDEIIKNLSAQELVLISNKTLLWSEFVFNYLQNKYDLTNFSQKKDFASEFYQEIVKEKDEQIRQYFIKRLNEITGFEFENKKVVDIKRFNSHHIEYFTDGLIKAQSLIISCMLNNVQNIEIYKEQLGFLPSEDYNRLALQIIKTYNDNLDVSSAILFNYLSDDLQQLLARIVAENLDNQIVREESFMLGCIRKVNVEMLNRELKNLDNDIMNIYDDNLKLELSQKRYQIIRKINDMMKKEIK
ncbi:MAG: DNA primase [Erysipelotrichaceae bacterium]